MDEILAVVDMDSAAMSEEMKEFIRESSKKGLIVSNTDDIPKSLVITKDHTAYLCRLNPATVLKRMSGQNG